MPRFAHHDRPDLPAPDFLSVSEVAERTDLTRRQVERLIAARTLGSVKVGRRRLIPVEAYDAWRAALIERAAS